MKKAFVLCLVLIASMITVTGSIAYFTDSIETRNIVESGNLHILQHEYERVKQSGSYTSTLRDYTQEQLIYPCVNPNGEREEVTVGEYTVSMYNESVGNFVDKIVVVENAGKNIAYVRTYVAVPAYADANGDHVEWLHLDKNETDGWVWCNEPIEDQLIDGINYDIWYATNTNQLHPGKTTAPSLLGFYLDPLVNHNGTNYTYRDVQLCTEENLTILVATEASQAIVFEAVTADSGEVIKAAADVALDTTYGAAPGNNRHPWAKVVIVGNQNELNAALEASQYDAQIGLKEGAYTLPEALPNGIRLFAMDLNVTLTSPANLSAYDVEFDGVTFTNAVTFTGHGSFEDVVFMDGWSAAPATGDILFSKCVFDKYAQSAGQGVITLSECTKPDGTPWTPAGNTAQTE